MTWCHVFRLTMTQGNQSTLPLRVLSHTQWLISGRLTQLLRNHFQFNYYYLSNIWLWYILLKILWIFSCIFSDCIALIAAQNVIIPRITFDVIYVMFNFFIFQMVWESESNVIVNLTLLEEDGVTKCFQYWPEQGMDTYHIYEVSIQTTRFASKCLWVETEDDHLQTYCIILHFALSCFLKQDQTEIPPLKSDNGNWWHYLVKDFSCD